MTFEEAKKILKKEVFGIRFKKFDKPLKFEEKLWIRNEKPEVLEALHIVAKNGIGVSVPKTTLRIRSLIIKKMKAVEGEPAPVSGTPLSAAEGMKLRWKDNKNTDKNPALAEAASQFNDALLDEQAKKIAELTKENERLERVSKTTTDEFNELYYRMITKSDKIEALGKEIAKLNGIIHKKNLKIEELGKESSRHLEGKMKMFGENFDLEQELKDKDAVLADAAEELRLSKIREKNLTEVSQKYIKENEKLKKEIADLGKELKAKKALVDHISKIRDSAKINLKLRMDECEKLNEALDEAKKQNTAVMVDMTAKCLRAARESINDVFESYAAKYAKSSLDGLKEKAYELFNAKAHNLGLVGNKDGNGIIDQMAGVDIAEEGGDHTDVIVLCGKYFVKKYKEIEIEKALILVRKAMKEGHTVTIDYKD